MFRYKVKIIMEDHGDFKKMLVVQLHDRNDVMNYNTAYMFNMESVPNEYIIESLNCSLNEILNKVATDRPNLHCERDLHKDCLKRL